MSSVCVSIRRCMIIRDHPPPHFLAVYGEHEPTSRSRQARSSTGGRPHRRVGWCGIGRLRGSRDVPTIGARRERASAGSGSQGWTMMKVVEIERRGAHRLAVRFSDGSFGEHDFSSMTAEPGSLLEPLRDPVHFDRMFLEFGAPAWPNGFDIDPTCLH